MENEIIWKFSRTPHQQDGNVKTSTISSISFSTWFQWDSLHRLLKKRCTQSKKSSRQKVYESVSRKKSVQIAVSKFAVEQTTTLQAFDKSVYKLKAIAFVVMHEIISSQVKLTNKNVTVLYVRCTFAIKCYSQLQPSSSNRFRMFFTNVRIDWIFISVVVLCSRKVENKEGNGI